ncbi:MAG: hypothetical protein DIU76_06345 [Bacillota bacterium]|nr:MAG: hypothetical protein DIU76_06345 [Bacillota bacterium]
MARRGLAERVGIPEGPSVGILDGTALAPADRDKELQRRWEERIQQESGETTSYFDPAAFEWVHRDQIYATERSLVRIDKNGISVTVGTKDEGAMALLGARVEVGFAKAAMAIRTSARPDAYKLARHHGAVRRGTIRSPKLVREAAKRGFGPGTLLEARWDPRSRMLVGLKPRPAQGEGRAS